MNGRHTVTVRTPLLRDDRSTLDFPNSNYAAIITQSPGENEVIVDHQLIGAVSLRNAIDRGDAAYVSEIRNHYGVCGETHIAGEPTQTLVVASRSFTDARTFVYPGIVALKEFEVPVNDLHPLWQQSVHDSLTIPAGSLLALATPERLATTTSPFFALNLDRNLKPGQIRVVDSSHDEPHFDVFFAEDLYLHVRTRDPFGRALRVLAWSQIMALLPRTEMKKGGQHEQSHAAQRLRSKLRSDQVSDWHTEEFDAGIAATVIAPLVAPQSED